MSKIVTTTERLRRAHGMTQLDLAARLGISQAHYSKVAGGLVPLSEGLAERMAAWVSEVGDRKLAAASRGRDARVRELSKSIQRQCRQLADLIAAADMAAGDAKGPGASRTQKR